MEQARLSVLPRNDIGKSAARRLRAEGFIPGVAYGKGRDSVAVTIPAESLKELMRHHAGGNVLLDLSIEGVQSGGDSAALIRDIHRDPVSRELLSVDLQWVSLREKITVTVPVVLEGEPAGVDLGGSLEQMLHELEVSCLPTAIPEQITVDVSALQIGDVLHVSALTALEGVELLADPEAPVAAVLAPLSEEELEARLAPEELEGVTIEAVEEESEED